MWVERRLAMSLNSTGIATISSSSAPQTQKSPPQEERKNIVMDESMI